MTKAPPGCKHVWKFHIPIAVWLCETCGVRDFGRAAPGQIAEEIEEKWAAELAKVQEKTPPSLVNQFDTRLAGLVNTERGAIYGHPAENFRRQAALQTIIAECQDPELRTALSSIGQKVARLIASPDHFDSWLDIAGYARTAVMILDRRAE